MATWTETATVTFIDRSPAVFRQDATSDDNLYPFSHLLMAVFNQMPWLSVISANDTEELGIPGAAVRRQWTFTYTWDDTAPVNDHAFKADIINGLLAAARWIELTDAVLVSEVEGA